MPLKREELFDRLLVSIDQQFSGNSPVNIPSLGEWAEQTPVILDGKPFTFKRHEYLMEPYQDDHTFQVEMKAAQMGLTSSAMLKTIYRHVTAHTGAFSTSSRVRQMLRISPKAVSTLLSMRIPTR